MLLTTLPKRLSREVTNVKYSAVSLFSGALGLDIGLENAGFETLVVNEVDSAAVATIKRNKPNLPVIGSDVSGVTLQTLEEAAGRSLGNLDLLFGGPPCQ